MEDLLILYSSLQPQVSLMEKMLHMAGGDWHARELRRHYLTGSRTYPLDQLSMQGGYLDIMMQECLTHLVNPTNLQHVAQTERNASKVLSTTLRLAATIYQVAFIPLQKLPFQLFQILRNEDMAEVCAALPACCRDEFSNAVLGRYPSADLLKSPECKAVLSSVKEHMDMNTYSTERLHSQTQRRQKARAQTSVADLAQLAAWRQAKASWRWCAKLKISEQRDHASTASQQMPEPDGADEVDEKGQPKATHPAKRRKTTRGGGSFRAFVHHCGVQGRLKGLQKFPSWLKTEYDAMTEEEREYYVNLGGLGTRAKRTTGVAFPKLSKRQSSVRAGSTDASLGEAASASDGASMAASSSSDVNLSQASRCSAAPVQVFDSQELAAMFKKAAKEMKQTASRRNRATAEEVAANTETLLTANVESLPALRKYLPFLGEGAGVTPFLWPHTSPTVALHFDVKTLFAQHSQLEQGSIKELAQKWETRHIGICARRYPAVGRGPKRKHCAEAG